MAKGYNPADAHRKAEKKKAAKKNKQDRQTAKELNDIKKGTGSLEKEIRDLSNKDRTGTLSSAERADLDGARAELARLRKAKDDYAKANPDQRDANASGSSKQTSNTPHDAQSVTVQGIQISLKHKREAEAQGLRFDKKGRLLNPEKSAYYDPTFNPFGVPPPGMPYRARPPTAEELALLEQAQDSDNDDIVMPDGPRPGVQTESEGSSDSDDIPMPEGPPPLPPGAPPSMQTSYSLPPQTSSVAGLLHSLHSGPLPTIPRFAASPVHSGEAPPQLTMPARPHITAGPSTLATPADQAAATSSSQASKSSISSHNDQRPTATVTISAGPQVRDLKKEALSFAPSALKRKRPTAGASAAQAVKAPRKEAGLSAVPLSTGMSLPPGFGPFSAMPTLPPGFASETQSQSDSNIDHGENEDEYMVQGPSKSDYGAYAPLPGFSEGDRDNGGDEDEYTVQGPSRSEHGAYAPLPGFIEGDGDIEDRDHGPALPSIYHQSDLPGFDEGEVDEAGDEQGAVLPPVGYRNTLAGFDGNDLLEN